MGPPCRICGKAKPVICYPDDHSQTVCPDCCDKATHADGETGHVWYYSRDDRRQECERCGIPKECTPYAFDYDDEFGGLPPLPRAEGPIGTPIDQLSGRPGEPGYDEFVRIAKSWGYD